MDPQTPSQESYAYDRHNGEHQTCGNCGAKSADCECGAFEAVDALEYDSRYDDEGD